VAGRVVARVYEGAAPAGWGELRWDGVSASGGRAAPGTYFCRMETAMGTRSVRIVLVR